MGAGADPDGNKRSPDDEKKPFLVDEIFSRLPKRRFKGRWTIHLGAKNYAKNYLCLVFLRDGEKKTSDDSESQGRLDILSICGGSNGRMAHSGTGLEHRPLSLMALFKTFKTNMAAVCELDSSKFSMDDVKMYAKRDSNGILEQIQRSAWLCEYDEVLRHVQMFLAEHHRKSSSKTISLAVRWIMDREIEDQAKDPRPDLAVNREGHQNHHRGGDLPQAQAAAAVNYHHHQHHHHHHRNCQPQPLQQSKRNNYKKQEVHRRYEVLDSSSGDGDPHENNINTTHDHLLEEGTEKEPAAGFVPEGDCDSCPEDDINSFEDDDDEDPNDDHDDHDWQQPLSSKNGVRKAAAPVAATVNLAEDENGVEVEVEVCIDKEDEEAIPAPLSSPSVRAMTKPQLRKRNFSAAGLRSRSVSPVAAIPRPSSTQAPPPPNPPPSSETGSARVVVPSSIRVLPGSRGSASATLAAAAASRLAGGHEKDFTAQRRASYASHYHHHIAPKQAKTEPMTMQAHYKQAVATSSAASPRRECPPTTIVTRASTMPERKGVREYLIQSEFFEDLCHALMYSTMDGGAVRRY